VSGSSYKHHNVSYTNDNDRQVHPSRRKGAFLLLFFIWNVSKVFVSQVNVEVPKVKIEKTEKNEAAGVKSKKNKESVGYFDEACVN
jgi:hypothetical protein